MRLVDFVTLARERLALMGGVVAVAVAAAVGLSLLQAPSFEATVRVRTQAVLAGRAPSPSAVVAEQQTDLATEAELVRSTAVARRVASAVGGGVDDLLDSVHVTGVQDSAVLRITAGADNRQRAMAIANGFAASYLAVRQEQVSAAIRAESARQARELRLATDRLAELDGVVAAARPGSTDAIAAQAERDQLIAELAVVRTRMVALADPAAVVIGSGEILQPATEAITVRDQSPPRAVVFGTVIGLPLAFAVVLLLDSLRNTVRTGDEVARLVGARLLGSVLVDAEWDDPAAARLIVLDEPRTAVAESYRMLSHNLNRVAATAGASTVLFTGPAGAGTTSLVANLGIALADVGRPASLVEADLRHPRLHRFVGADPEPGLTDVLGGVVALDDATRQLDVGVQFLAAGDLGGRPDLLVRGGELGAVLAELMAAPQPRMVSSGRQRPKTIASRMLLLDTPSILDAAEVSTMAAQVDGVVVVARAGTTTKHELAAAAEQVRRAGGDVLGVVLIGVRSVAEGTPVVDTYALEQVGAERSSVG